MNCQWLCIQHNNMRFGGSQQREKKKRSRLLQVINHSDDITEAFLMNCSRRCQAWVEPSRGNHLTCGRKISGSLKTCISHCKQYFTTIRTLKYLRLSQRPEPLPLCCRAWIYHFHYFQVYSQPVFSFFLFLYPESNWCVVLRGGQGLADVCRWRRKTKHGPGEDMFTDWWSDVLCCCRARWKSTQRLFAAGALASSANDGPVPLDDGRNRGEIALMCDTPAKKFVSVKQKNFFYFPLQRCQTRPRWRHTLAQAQISASALKYLPTAACGPGQR